ncbi:hypothetical protein [Altererythrobacter sp. Root672]|uniref:hypothetical protein n=1 Tax=Altererythrobacter sp. Root672 TaxID=1736584 RepID=UPI0006F511C8|nr:hypothetical protein [Altererythrobacter sp. Root672]KRA81617.1 hypothetical protein ASD76_13925 [Altererythrobacter sp. Root672]
MVRSATAATGKRGNGAAHVAPAKRPPPKKPAIDTSALSLEQLAQAVLAGEVKPRVADLRRLATAILEPKADEKPKKAKGEKTKKEKGKHKLPKIPGQKKKKAKA